MATKKTQKKKTDPTKVYKPHKPFDLDVKTQQQAMELTAHLELLKVSAGWAIMRQILEGNLAVLERSIVTKKVGDKILTDAEVDDLRKTHAVMEELINKPDELIGNFKKQTGIEIPTYDPYATDAKQLRGDGSVVGAPMASPLTNE